MSALQADKSGLSAEPSESQAKFVSSSPVSAARTAPLQSANNTRPGSPSATKSISVACGDICVRSSFKRTGFCSNSLSLDWPLLP
jgi:hypothetical protein